MYELNSLECRLKLTDLCQGCSKLTFRNIRCFFLHIVRCDSRTNNVDYYNEVLEQDNGKITHGKQMFC
jgi:hypothetical protein